MTRMISMREAQMYVPELFQYMKGSSENSLKDSEKSKKRITSHLLSPTSKKLKKNK